MTDDVIYRQTALDEKNIVHIEMFGRDLPVVPVATLKELPPAQPEVTYAIKELIKAVKEIGSQLKHLRREIREMGQVMENRKDDGK